jgi:hypothetical protein
MRMTQEPIGNMLMGHASQNRNIIDLQVLSDKLTSASLGKLIDVPSIQVPKTFLLLFLLIVAHFFPSFFGLTSRQTQSFPWATFTFLGVLLGVAQYGLLHFGQTLGSSSFPALGSHSCSHRSPWEATSFRRSLMMSVGQKQVPSFLEMGRKRGGPWKRPWKTEG